MRRFFLSLLVGVVALSFVFEAQAQRRLGGGRTMGRQVPQTQKSPAPQPAATPTPTAASTPAPTSTTAPVTTSTAAPAAQTAPLPTPTPATPAPARSPMKNMLMGAAAGLGLMALASWLGFGEGLATVMLFALVAVGLFMLVSLLMRRRAQTQQPVYVGAYDGAQGGTLPPPTPLPPATAVRPGSAMAHFMGTAPQAPTEPAADFNAENFLAHARLHFEKLQAAWQSGDLDALADFTTHEMFVTLTHELRERVMQPQSTQVVALQAQLLGMESAATEHLARVHFTGTLRIDSEEEAVDEVWNLTQPANGDTGWLLAGIQQTNA